MCGVCGCGESRIEGHEHSHEHAGDHVHPHGHSYGHGSATVIVQHHHHYYYPQEPHQPVTHDAGHHHHHDENEGKDLHYGRGEAGNHVPGISQRRLMKIERDVLDKNNQLASHNREHFKKGGQLVLNLVSSPGSGKTTLLVETLKKAAGKALLRGY